MPDYSEQNKDFKKLAERQKAVEDETEKMTKRAMNRENRKIVDRLQRERSYIKMDVNDYAKKHKIDFMKAHKQLKNVVNGGLVHTLRGEIIYDSD